MGVIWVSEPMSCPACGSDDYVELDSDFWDDDMPVYECFECGESWS